MRKPRAVLLCGHERPLLAAIARELARAQTPRVIQAAPTEVAAAQRLCRGAPGAAVVVGELGGDAAGRRLIRAAWNAARGLDSVIICPAITSVAGACDAGLDAWQLGFDAGLRAPFFLAKEVGRRFRRSGGGLVFAIDSVPRGAAALPHVIRSALLTMIDALARALPPTVAVAAVVGGRQSPAVEVARSVRLLMAEGLRASGTVLELGEPRRRG